MCLHTWLGFSSDKGNNNLQNFIPKIIGYYQIKLNSYHQNNITTLRYEYKGYEGMYIVWVKMTSYQFSSITEVTLIKVKQVDLGISSLNKTDCFILDCGKGQDIFVYMPEGSSRMERFKGTQAANAIRDEDHAGEGTVIQNKFSRSEIKLFHCIFKTFFNNQFGNLVN